MVFKSFLEVCKDLKQTKRNTHKKQVKYVQSGFGSEAEHHTKVTWLEI